MKKSAAINQVLLIRFIFTLVFMVMVLPVSVLAAGDESTDQITKANINRQSSPDTRRFSLNPDPGEIGVETGIASAVSLPSIQAYGNPAGCALADAPPLPAEKMLANVQAALGSEYNLAALRQTYIWNGFVGSMMDVTQESFAYEFAFNSFAPPLTYLGDRVATVFLTNGFVIWFREYNGIFRLLAIPMSPGVYESDWAGYLKAYWQEDSLPGDEFIFPVIKKLPCSWAIEQGYVSQETVEAMFQLDWNTPDYLTAGRQYLATTCAEANRISRDVIGFWDASAMCGPLTWTIMRDVDGFPYRIGAWTAGPAAFTAANPRWNYQPWSTFDPETYHLEHIHIPMAGYDFALQGDLYAGDIVYSFTTLYVTPGLFDHIFLVAGVNEKGSRVSITNMVQSHPHADCSISEVILYTPGDRLNGVINHEWNGFGYGLTGTSGFDIFRWNWITYHVEGQPIRYTVRWGDTIETIAFDWKVSPESILSANMFEPGVQLLPGQVIQLPTP